jgi:Cu-Zn family superoxide dismutase
MKRTIAALAALSVLLVGAIAVSAGSASAPQGGQDTRARARLVDAAGNTVANVLLDTVRGKTVVAVEAAVLTSGFHGFHVHAVGICDAAGGFASAGGHFNPAAAGHGSHAGDMPPLLVATDGRAAATFVTDRFTVDQLFDADGSAIIVHAGSDNLANIPTRYHSHVPDASSTTFGPDATTLATGDAGARTACGVVRRSR